ncbi:MAG: OmpA family protein [Cystobacterineae bacterium]|nr:OmpA family protein [Cystobacterineae bacterium]
MPSLYTPVLATLLLFGIETAESNSAEYNSTPHADPEASFLSPPQADPAPDPHTPSTLYLEVGDARNVRAAALQRSVGLFYTHSAQLGRPGLLHFSLLVDYSHANHFPKTFEDGPGSPASGSLDSSFSDTSRWTATFAAAWVFLPWLEAYASYELSSSYASYGTSSPTTTYSGQILGDTTLGLKLAHRFAQSFYAGMDLGLRVFTTNQSVQNIRFAFQPSALLTWNAQELSPRVPLILHANLGLGIGHNGPISLEQLSRETAWKTFAWNLTHRHHASVRLALEAPLPYATPFVEYRAIIPFWNEEDRQASAAFTKANPQSLLFGAKLTMLPSFTLTLGGEVNLKTPHIPSFAPSPPWRVFLGVSLATEPFVHSAFSPLAASQRLAAPPLSPIVGRVVDAHTQQPLPHVDIKLGPQELQSQHHGHFQSQALPPGSYTVEINAPGYFPKTQTLLHGENPNETHLISLVPSSAQLVLSLRRGNKFVLGQVLLRGPSPQSFPLETASVFNIPAGPQLLELIPQEGLAKILNVHFSPGQKQTLSLDIEAAPAAPHVRLVNQRLVLAEPLAFASHKAELTARGQAQLRSLVDALIRNNIKSLRLESHVEAQKTEAHAMQLSAQRAQAVVDALARLGVDAERIEVLNWGDTKPVAPNTVSKGRLLNRRMDFVVLEKW